MHALYIHNIRKDVIAVNVYHYSIKYDCYLINVTFRSLDKITLFLIIHSEYDAL